MKAHALARYVPTTGALLSVLLIGLILLSALLYYRAVKIQRYLEPALAVAQPRNEFSKTIIQGFQKEFGAEPVPGMSVRAGSILVEKSVLFTPDGADRETAQEHLRKLARMFLSLMDDNHMRADISLVLIGSRFRSMGDRVQDGAERKKAQQLVGRVQDAMFAAEPDLRRQYETYFLAAVQPGPPSPGSEDWLEFRIVPSEMLHIEVLQKLVKYAF